MADDHVLLPALIDAIDHALDAVAANLRRRLGDH